MHMSLVGSVAHFINDLQARHPLSAPDASSWLNLHVPIRTSSQLGAGLWHQ